MGGFREFCGNSSIFDLNLLLNNTWPEFTPCFLHTVLTWVPCGFLWLMLPIYLLYLALFCQGPPIHTNKLNVSKTLLSLLLCLLSVIDVLKAEPDSRSQSQDVPDVLYVSGGIKIASYLLAAVLVQVERKKGLITSGVLWVFWLFTVIASIVPFYTKIYLEEYDSHLFSFAVFTIYFALVLTQFIVSSFAERKTQRRGYSPLADSDNTSPEVGASFPSRLSFWWMNSLILKAYRQGLVESDLFELHPRDKSTRVVPQLGRAWQRELARANRKYKVQQQNQRVQNGYASFYKDSSHTPEVARVQTSDEKTPLLRSEATPDVVVKDGAKNPADSGPPASLFKVLAKTYGLELLQAHFCKFVYDLLQFVSPLLLNVLIDYTHNKPQIEADGQQWKGYVYASSFFVVSFIGSIMFNQNFHIGMSLGMRVKSALIAAVYKKSLTISNDAKKASTVGEIVNLMSVDCQRMQDVVGYLWMMWSSPLQIFLALYMLWGVMGIATLAGLAVMVLLLPVNAFIAMKQRKFQMAQMKFKDARIKLMSEVLGGMKVLKLYAWESSFQDKVEDIRRKELDILKKTAYLNAFSTFCWTCAPFMVTLATFATYVLVSENHYLDANKAFVAMSLLNILRFPINLLPMMVSFIVQASVSVGRIGRFLKMEDLDLDCVRYDSNAEHAVSIRGGQFSWDKSNPSPTLSNINLSVGQGQLIAVVGPVGAGKSSLVSSILGEMEKLGGEVVVKSSVAYVPQQAWIQNATLKDNILFGQSEDNRVYQKVLEACALKSDLDILPGGDQTEIGEKGINLSGGQKQRVSLARAVYSDADIFLLDDPLSAVDSHVGKHIFDKVISDRGMLKRKTRILVTHGVHWLPQVDRIVVLTDGRISEIGSYEELMSHDGAFAQFLRMYLATEESDDEDEKDPEIAAIKARMMERVDSVTSDTGATSGDERVRSSKRLHGDQLSRQVSRQLSRSTTVEKEEGKGKERRPGDRLIEEEKAETGKVKFAVFMDYFRAIGLLATCSFLAFFAGYQAASVYSSIWLSDWTADPVLNNLSLSNTSQYQDKNDMYLGVYGGLGIVQAVLILFYSIIASTRMVRASGLLHTSMLTNVMKSPMSFFDTTPSGRILNRFSRDVETIDNTLPQQVRSWMNTAFGTLSTIIVISYSTPIFMSVIVPLGVMYYLVQRFYIPTSRQLKRIESTTRSPIYTHFSETITGAASIRAYKVDTRFIHDSESKVDKNLVFYFAGIASNRWLATRLEFLGNFIVLAAAMFAVVSDVSESLVGLSVSYALQVTGGLNWMVRMTSDLETNIVSVERVKEYSETPTEAAWINPFKRPPPSWPQEGTVSFLDYKTRYRPGLDLVLKGINCQIMGGEKIGIVGRTGAGKSSMTVALFRLIEAASGSIIIDSNTISDIGLHDLRSKITILPQDPVLFSGTMRMNLDPFDTYSDEQVWRALEYAHLKTFVQDVPGGLLYECGEGGQNLSVGQRQLVCLARSLLRKTKILVLDEATAAVDMETDDLIQKTIRSEFKDCTVLTIAHRLNTILDYDRIMVLDQGQIIELDTPAKLLENTKSVFYGMCKDANLV
ncbi:multidrug resistance-associated protein 1 [Aplysia californica]|uniref:ABC-type glutathione-S-conjugate transporter n=1 Tax=Aplysia californica TaxID=6500 RepID=A0ABM1AAM8_APLCA|nr:multidrug resistance-associated protein 1 [Aplysia californica]